MSILAIAVVAVTLQPPTFDPMRGHVWGETIEQAKAIEAQTFGNEISPLDPLIKPGGTGQIDYLLLKDDVIKAVSLGFTDNRLDRISYFLDLLTVGELNAEASAREAARVLPVRDWLFAHFGQPEYFKSNVKDLETDFHDAELLVPEARNTFDYGWCSDDTAARLYAEMDNMGRQFVYAALFSQDRASRIPDKTLRNVCFCEGS